MRRVTAVLVAACVCATATPAQAQEQKVCTKTVAAKGKKWSFQGSGVGCKFQEKWTKAFLRDGEKPPGYKCTRVRKRALCEEKKGEAIWVMAVVPKGS